jgi:hypothetical protein
MKHNPRLNEKMARLPGFADIHPLQPQATVQGALELIDEPGHLAEDADQHARRGDEPKAGAHGELRHDGDPRRADRRGEGETASGCWCRNRPTAPTRRPPSSAVSLLTRSRPTSAAASMWPT